jgi:hypothetical protein
MHVVTNQIPREFIRSVRLRSRPAQNQRGWLSLGSGGQTGNYEENFEFNGSASTFKASIPEDVQSGRYGMLVYLHGDGAGDYNWFWNSSKQIAARHNMIAVHVLSPTATATGAAGGIAGDSNADILNALLHDRILTRYNIDNPASYSSGQSGGPTFMTGTWMNKYAQQFMGGSVLMCGGLLFTNSTMQAPPEWRKAYKLRIETTANDFLNSGLKGPVRGMNPSAWTLRLTTQRGLPDLTARSIRRLLKSWNPVLQRSLTAAPRAPLYCSLPTNKIGCVADLPDAVCEKRGLERRAASRLSPPHFCNFHCSGRVDHVRGDGPCASRPCP